MPRVRDILVVPTDPNFDPNAAAWDEHPPAWDAPIALGVGLRLERLATEEAEAVMDAATPAGRNFHATRQFGQFYSLVLDVPEEAIERRRYGWDPNGAISAALVLSRLVVDNAYCYEFCGRMIERDGAELQIVPPRFDQPIAFRLRNDRYWMTVAEAETLATLIEAYIDAAVRLSPRVHTALWHAERSAYARYLDEALVSIVTGLEALLKTDRYRITRQFIERAPQLVAELGLEIAGDPWQGLYDARSAAVHGARTELYQPDKLGATAPVNPLVVPGIAAQTVLRAAIRRAIEDDDFRSAFIDAEAVRARFAVDLG